MFTEQEHITNKERLGVKDYNELVNRDVYYVKPSYGVHKVLEWRENEGVYLLGLEGQKFLSNPFKINLVVM